MPLAVLVADPEQATRSFLGRHLADDGFAVVEARAADEALALAERVHPDLVLLGNPLPDLSALEVCRLLREGEPGRGWDRDVPVIVLDGAEADSVDRVRAFDRGCDDYVARPFVYDELVARMRAILRRTGPRQGDRVVAGAIVVDRRTRSVTVDGVEVALAGKEYELLLKLATDPERVFPKEELLRDVWGFRSLGRTRTLDSHASRLRRKLGRGDPSPYVINAWGVGYRLLRGQ